MKKVTLLLLSLLSGMGWAQEADIGVSVRLFQSRIITGDLAKMEITINNQGPDTADGIRLDVDVLQGQFRDITTTAPGPCQISVPNGQVRCQNVGDFASGEQKVLLLRVQLQQSDNPQDLILQANVSSPTMDPRPGNNVENIVFQVAELPSVENYAAGMLTAMPEERKKRFLRAARVLGAYCSGESLHTALDGFCDDILQQAELGDFETLTRVMNWMRPRNVVHQARNSTKLVASQLSNIGQRVAQLRAGTSGFSLSGLQLNNGKESLPISMLAYLANQDNEQAQSFVSPWGFFVNGSLTSGDFNYADEVNDGFDFDSDSLSAGVDYRFSNRFVLGGAIGYNTLESDTGAGVSMETEGLSYSLYGLFTPTENFYLDARLSYARPDVKQVRVELFEVIDEVISIRALGETQSQQLTAALNAGYNFYRGSWQWSPYVGMEHVDSELDGYTETGAGSFNTLYAQQDFESTKFHLGFNVSRAISTRNGVLSPQFSYQHHYEDQDNGIMEMRLINMPMDELFNVETNFTKSNYGQASMGLTWVTANGKMFYLRYSRLIGLDDFDQDTISFGARFEF